MSSIILFNVESLSYVQHFFLSNAESPMFIIIA